MSTRLPPTPAEILRSAWRRLRTMRTAIILLLILGAGAAVGSLIPQRPINAATVEAWKMRHAAWAGISEHLGLFDVFGSWWFMTIYVLLLVSLVGCLGPRYRAWVKALRARPRALETLAGQQQYTAGTVALAPEQALEDAENLLRSKRFRLERSNGTVAAEKGHWREGGSLVFHTAFLVLLLGVSMGKWFGFTGQMAVIEGERFSDTHVDYDSITEGRFFNEHHRGFSVAVDDFDVAWHPNGVPERFVSTVRVFDGGDVVKGARVEVNHPLTYRGVTLYQLNWGWAPDIRITQNRKVLYDGPTIFRARGDAWHGVAKIPQSEPQQTGFDFFFYTDPSLGADNIPRNGSPEPKNPLLITQMFQGDLGLSVSQNVYELDEQGLVPIGNINGIPMGAQATFPNGITVQFRGLKQYTVFQIASNPGAPILLIAAIMILVGLIPALYSSRRRVWVRAAAQNGVARLEIAGHALQRKAAFEEEFKTLVRDLDRNLHARTTARERVGANDG